VSFNICLEICTRSLKAVHALMPMRVPMGSFAAGTGVVFCSSVFLRSRAAASDDSSGKVGWVACARRARAPSSAIGAACGVVGHVVLLPVPVLVPAPFVFPQMVRCGFSVPVGLERGLGPVHLGSRQSLFFRGAIRYLKAYHGSQLGRIAALPHFS
jgi:hypothetical protein